MTTTTRAATTTTASSTSTTTTAASTTSTTAGSTACNHVSATAGQGQGAAGTITGTITLTNTGSAACTVNGYPTMALFSGSGAPLTVTMVNGLSVTISSAANAAPSSFSLAPSSTAQFAYQFSDVPVGAQTNCPTSESASATMPGATTASPTFQLAIGPCGNGTIRVSPVYAGS
ncbi:MAG TPA: DUF4232 domain-containing protein [Acidimicrobiales bacterium]|nr:DUF4232 domain-containing protein [Acidimicrobiales bacterium]